MLFLPAKKTRRGWPRKTKCDIIRVLDQVRPFPALSHTLRILVSSKQNVWSAHHLHNLVNANACSHPRTIPCTTGFRNVLQKKIIMQSMYAAFLVWPQGALISINLYFYIQFSLLVQLPSWWGNKVKKILIRKWQNFKQRQRVQCVKKHLIFYSPFILIGILFILWKAVYL